MENKNDYNGEDNSGKDDFQEDEGFSLTPEKVPDRRPKISPVSAAFIGLVLVFFLYQLGGSLLTLLIFGFNFKDADLTAMRLLTTAGQLLFILLPALILTRLIYRNVTAHIRIKPVDAQETVIFSIGLFILTSLLQSYLYLQNAAIIKLAQAYPSINGIKSYIDKIDKVVESSYNTLLTSQSFFESLLIVIVVAVVPAICEEFFFRGYVQRSFELKIRPFTSALVTAFFFGLYHFHPYQIVPLTALGLYFGFAAYMSETIFLPMILHFLNNLIAVLMFFVYGSDDVNLPQTVPAADLRVSVMVFLSLAALFTFFMIYVNRIYYKKSN
ncbi:MAG: CPBP family intramembrane metalloprotease [Ignavibacteria bacterium]|jgi:membrane protease YdiL (CAAX protease family)|nr:CPBP family intramembrane metalloprotease [Ignavibacteria bacterium]MCU7504180.1 CPBP family intramembrane metalloprotease [Ignavibacteria bacterium]MCU7516370.1 CPBP family intramembrane metalloprotease [Ignavibacteria bacterium]